MKNIEIERKFLIQKLPADLQDFAHHEIEQGYLCSDPVVRIRRRDDTYILTLKSGGLMEREEYEIGMDAEAYAHLKPKTDGILIGKTRYLIPYKDHTIELDVFHGEISPLVLAEVEFDSVAEAEQFVPPDWFGKEVTEDVRYQNAYLSAHGYDAAPGE